jgi:hypothetical protein
MLCIEEPDGTIAVYNERGVLENHFATRKEAQAWLNYRNREEAASPKIAERTKSRTRRLIAKRSAEAAAEVSLEVEDARLEVRWDLEDLLEELHDE